jgi:prolyl-tRNA editing enzyme YbaK/EbsC (Cys-tRNA(Pro) deacylase)
VDDGDDIEQRVRSRLDALGVEYEIVPCDPELADTAAFCEAYGHSPEDSANTIVVVGKSDPPTYVACVVLATTRLDVNKVVRSRLGVRKASFADADSTRAITGMAIGGVTAVGLPDDMPIWIDARVMTGRRSSSGAVAGRARCSHRRRSSPPSPAPKSSTASPTDGGLAVQSVAPPA